METKKKYIVPGIELILLDSEISLALQSEAPPDGPGESISNLAPEYFSNDPRITNLT